MPRDGRRSAGYRPFVTCDDPKGVVECGSVRKYTKSNHLRMEPSSDARVRPKGSSRGVDREEPGGQASFQLLEVSKGAQKLNHVIESWSRGISAEGQPKDIAKDLLKGALDLQESLMMLGKLQAASKYVARLKQKQDKSEHPGPPTYDLSHDQEIGFRKPEVSPGDESSRKNIEELREVIRSSLARQNRLHRRKSEPHPEIPSTSSYQCSSVNYDEKNDAVPDTKTKSPNIIAKLMGLEEISLRTAQRKLQDKKIMHEDVPELKKPEPQVRGVEPDRRTLSDVLETMKFKGLLRSNSIRKTPAFNADDAPPIVLIKPTLESHIETNGVMPEGKGASDTITLLKSLKANEKFPHRRIGRKEVFVCDIERIHEKPQLKEIPTIDSCQERGSTCAEVETGSTFKGGNIETNSNISRCPSPPVKEQVKREKRGNESGDAEKLTKSSQRPSEKANFKAKSKQQSKDQTKASAQVTEKPEGRLNQTKKEVSPRRTRNGRQDQEKKEMSTPEVQRCKKTISNQKKRTPSPSCRDRKRSPGKEPTINEPKLAEDCIAPEEDVIKSDTVKLEASSANDNGQCAEQNADASESEVGASEKYCGIEALPLLLAAPTDELRTETDAKELVLEGFETEDHIKSLLLSSSSFLSHAEDLFDFVLDPPALLQKGPDSGSIPSNDRLLIDYANELMECRTMVHASTSSLVVIGLDSSRARISFNYLLEEISKGMEKLGSYCKLGRESLLMDSLYAKLERDLSLHRGGAVSKLWDEGWIRGFCREDAEHVANELEETLLGRLIEETLSELVR